MDSGYFTQIRKQPLNIAFVGSKQCGKSAFIQRILKCHTLHERESFLVHGTYVPCHQIQVPLSETWPVRLLEVDSSLVVNGRGWPTDLPALDAVILCYDVSNLASFSVIPELMGYFYSKSIRSMITVALKSDLPNKTLPDAAADACDVYGIGLVEANILFDSGKLKMRQAFYWLLKKVLRQKGALTLGSIKLTNMTVSTTSLPLTDSSSTETATLYR